MSKYLIESTGIIYGLYLRVRTLHPDSKLIYSNFRDKLTSYLLGFLKLADQHFPLKIFCLINRTA